MTRFAAIALVVVLGLTGCQTAPNDRDELDQARSQVQRLFEAIDHGDCATLATLVPATTPAGACDKFLHEWREDLHIKLVDVPDVRRDGRDHAAIIVRTTVLRRDQQQTMLVRVTHEHGAWQLAL